MNRFIIIKNNFDNILDVIDTFKTLVGQNIELFEKENCIITKYNYDNQRDINDLLVSFSNENMIGLTCYVSSLSSNVIEEEIGIGLKLIKSLPIGVYDLKGALLLSKNLSDCKNILDAILGQSGIDEDFVRRFVLYDLNISKASKCMYIHRNTLNYKLDKLLEYSGFDLRVFLDAYIIYNLIQNK